MGVPIDAWTSAGQRTLGGKIGRISRGGAGVRSLYRLSLDTPGQGVGGFRSRRVWPGTTIKEVTQTTIRSIQRVFINIECHMDSRGTAAASDATMMALTSRTAR